MPCAAGLAALCVYANSLGNGFVWDDPIILTRQLVVFRSVGDVLAPPRDIPQFSPDYYRPLTIASYLLDRTLGGGGPFTFHLSVVLTHAATSMLVAVLALQVLSPPGARRDEGALAGALGAGALFALHPIHTESVAWAAGRSDVLATGLLVAALIVHGHSPGTWTRSALTGVIALAALGAKETAIALYPLMAARDVLEPSSPSRGWRDWLRAWTGPVLALVLYAALRWHALGEVVGSAADALPMTERSPVELIGAIGMYVQRLLWPVGLNAYLDRIDTGLVQIALAALLIAGCGAAAWRAWWARAAEPPIRFEATPPLFALIWIAVTLVPSLAIVWKIPEAPLAERYLYLPSVGFCLLAGYGISRLWRAASSSRAQAAVASAVVAVLLASAVATVRRNRVWHDDVALWEDTESKSQVSGMAARSLGTAYQQRGRTAEAQAAFERALQRRNTPRGLQTIHNNLGTLAMYAGDYAAAQRSYEAALAANPQGADSMFNLGLAILHAGARSPAAAQAALPHYERARQLNPHDSDIEAALADAYDLLGQPAQAAQHARRALDLGAHGQTAESLRTLLQRNTDSPQRHQDTKAP